MDTHVNPDPDAERGEPVYSASLPRDLREEAAPAEGAKPKAQATAGAVSAQAPARSGRFGRRRLLLGGAVAAILVVGGGIYALSPANHLYPMPRLASAMRSLATQAGFERPSVLAPSASLAKINAPLPAPQTRQKYTPPPRDTELQEVIGFRGGASGAPTVHPDKTADAGPPPGYVPAEPGMIVAPQSTTPKAPAPRQLSDQPSPGTDQRPDLTASIVAGMRGSADPPATASPSTRPVPTPAQVQAAIVASFSPAGPPQPAATTPSPAPVPTPAVTLSTSPADRDPITVSEKLQANPMTPKEQVDVLQTVTRLAALIQEQKLAVVELRADVARADADNKVRIEDFSRRLALAEATSALDAAERPVTQEAGPSNADPSVIPLSPMFGRPPVVPAKATVAIAGDTGPRRYRVQAASPGLAMLAQVDRGGGDGAQVAVNVGDELPGYGKVKSVFQRGTTWVVSTEHGDIGQ